MHLQSFVPIGSFVAESREQAFLLLELQMF